VKISWCPVNATGLLLSSCKHRAFCFEYSLMFIMLTGANRAVCSVIDKEGVQQGIFALPRTDKALKALCKARAR